MANRNKRKKVRKSPGAAAAQKTNATDKGPAPSDAQVTAAPTRPDPVGFFVEVRGPRDAKQRRAILTYVAVCDSPDRSIAAVRAAVAGENLEVTTNTFPVGTQTLKAMGLGAGEVRMLATSAPKVAETGQAQGAP